MEESGNNTAGMKGFAQLGTFLGLITLALYLVLSGIGPDWLRQSLFIILIIIVLAIAIKGSIDQWKEAI